MKIAIGSDHAGFELKTYLKGILEKEKQTIADVGTENESSVDYPDFGIQVARLVSEGQVERGVLVCGTGVGMSITANKVRGVRAALAHNLFTAVQSRRHVDANVLVLGSRVIGKDLAAEMLKAWLAEPFEGGRHALRLEKLYRLEEECRNK
ncbi:MAG TPA: ribose 5-phosphate isomerase B [Syntrophorhabdales bacterium]|nr:ribose 5-phosphate isomerase B [Syntrophorhabdales bacterium]